MEQVIAPITQFISASHQTKYRTPATPCSFREGTAKSSQYVAAGQEYFGGRCVHRGLVSG